MRKFTLPRRPYNTVQVYKKSNILINPGVTVLVGCNGSGKSTLLDIIKRQLKKDDIPCLAYDNMTDGRNKNQKCLDMGEIGKLAALTTSSEGEQIIIKMNDYARAAVEFVKNKGEVELHGLERLMFRMMNDMDEAEKKPPTEYWFILDAIGSGLSIDNIVDLRKMFDKLCSIFPKDLTPYVIIAANDYEFCVDEQCFSVQDGKYVDIASYDDFKKFVIETRKYKENQYKKWAEKSQKRKADDV